MGVLTFDWSQIAYLGSPLIVPWWAEVNIFCGFALAFWVIAPIMYYTNVSSSRSAFPSHPHFSPGPVGLGFRLLADINLPSFRPIWIAVQHVRRRRPHHARPERNCLPSLFPLIPTYHLRNHLRSRIHALRRRHRPHCSIPRKKHRPTTATSPSGGSRRSYEAYAELPRGP